MVSMQTGHSSDDCRFSTNRRWEANRALYCASKSGVSDSVGADGVVVAGGAGVDVSQWEQPGRGAASCSRRLLLTASSMSAAYFPSLASRLARFAGRASSALHLSPSATGPSTSDSLPLAPWSPTFSPPTIPRPALKTLRTSAADSAACANCSSLGFCPPRSRPSASVLVLRESSRIRSMRFPTSTV